MKNYRKELGFFSQNKLYIGIVLFMVIIGYGFASTNISIGMDDIRGELEIGSGKEMIASGRISLAMWPYLLGYKKKWIENSFAIDIMAIGAFLWAIINACILFRKIAKKNIPDSAYMIFSCLTITYPLIHEIWEYTHINLCICIGILLETFVLLITYEQIQGNFCIWKLGISSVLSMVVCAGYESTVSVYIFLTFAILFLLALFDETYSVKTVLKQGIIYAGVLVSGMILRVIVHKAMLYILNMPFTYNGATGISWLSGNILSRIWGLVVGWVDNYFLKGFIYFPLTEMLFFGALYIMILICVVRKRACVWVPGLGMLLSLVALSILQGTISFYRTQSQVFAVFIGFTGMMLYYLIYKTDKGWRTYLIGGVLIFVSLHQAISLNYWLTMNHLRSNEEIQVIKTVGDDLKRDYDIDSKPVVILGEYTLSDYIQESKMINREDIRWKLYSYVYSWMHKRNYFDTYNNGNRLLCQTDINSVITWAIPDQIDIYNLFRIQGIDYIYPKDENLRLKAIEYIENHTMPQYPQKGYIEDRGEFIVVYLH